MSKRTINAAYNGNSKILGIWKTNHDGLALQIAQAAANELNGIWVRQGMIASNPRLSDLAKKEDSAKTSAQALPKLAGMRRQLQIESDKLNARAASLKAVTPYRDGDHSTVAIDLALAQHLQSMKPSQRAAALSQVGDLRLRDAILRLPSALTGVPVEKYAELERQALEQNHPKEAIEIEELRQALQDAAEVVGQAWIEASSGVELDERVKAAGDPATADALERNLTEESAERIHKRVSKEEEGEETEGVSDNEPR
ncbi:hypothetical protein [Vreelandella olivaria]|uniref:hypothetical protein n=1 Tax=Vreelandella olivaria TaxID=390919 RepID=UPI00201EDE6D|nr:hypothetical protein [Halomonas olivaria]